MLFASLIFLAAFLLEGIGTIMSVTGLTQILGIDYLIISLAVAFDAAKLLMVSFLYKEWKLMPKFMLNYLIIASLVLMTITSAGGGAYLYTQFQKALLPTKSIEVKVNALTEEKEKLEKRKKEIDIQIANLPVNMVKGRTKLMANFKNELDHVNERIFQLDEEVPKLQMEQIEKNSHAGPITAIAEAFHTTPEGAMKYIIGLIIFVFDPLAVVMILAGNYLISRKKSIPEPLPEPIKQLIENQQPLENEFEEPLQENLWDLYDSDPIKEEEVIPTSYQYFPQEMLDLAEEVAEKAQAPTVAAASLADANDTADVIFTNGNSSRIAKQVYMP